MKLYFLFTLVTVFVSCAVSTELPADIKQQLKGFSADEFSGCQKFVDSANLSISSTLQPRLEEYWQKIQAISEADKMPSEDIYACYLLKLAEFSRKFIYETSRMGTERKRISLVEILNKFDSSFDQTSLSPSIFNLYTEDQPKTFKDLIIPKIFEYLLLEQDTDKIKSFDVSVPQASKVIARVSSVADALKTLDKSRQKEYRDCLNEISKDFELIAGPEASESFNQLIKSLSAASKSFVVPFMRNHPELAASTYDYELVRRKRALLDDMHHIVKDAFSLKHENDREFALEYLKQYIPPFINFVKSIRSFDKIVSFTPLELNNLIGGQLTPYLESELKNISEYSSNFIILFFQSPYGIAVAAVIFCALGYGLLSNLSRSSNLKDDSNQSNPHVPPSKETRDLDAVVPFTPSAESSNDAAPSIHVSKEASKPVVSRALSVSLSDATPKDSSVKERTSDSGKLKKSKLRKSSKRHKADKKNNSVKKAKLHKKK